MKELEEEERDAKERNEEEEGDKKATQMPI